MIYDIKHLTTYQYGSSVTYSNCALRLLPRDEPGQVVYASRLEIEPAPAATSERFCFFGNRVTSMTVETAHRSLKVVGAHQRRDRPRAAAPGRCHAGLGGRARRGVRVALARRRLARAFPASQPLRAPLRAGGRLHAGEFPPGRPVLAGAVDLMRRIHKDFRYDAKATIVSTPLSEAFEKRHGVCQDFAHIMISGLRGIGLPAAYVSRLHPHHSAGRREAPGGGGRDPRLGGDLVRRRARLDRP